MKSQIHHHQVKFYQKRKFDFMNSFLNYEEFYETIGKEVKLFLELPSSYYLIERAKNEKWLGSLHSNKDGRGLLGYLRMNYGLQIKLIKNLSNCVVVHNNNLDQQILNWFASDFFKKTVLSNPDKKVILNFYKKEHLDLIRNSELKKQF